MQEKLTIFKSLFNGRNDVFALRREKEGRSEYMPAYDVDWQQWAEHKAKGGSFKTYANKKSIPLTDQTLINHLSGTETIGIYPLLENNTSWFIAADFDEDTTAKKSWIEECQLFISECNKHDLPVYLERSRSGKGGHVWLFFEQPIPAIQSRRLFTNLLISSGIISPFDKNSNFDRLFPNQDSHSGEGFGNLIALPLNGKSLKNQNACFINPSTGEFIEDQWSFLKTIQKVSQTKFDKVYGLLSDSSGSETTQVQSFNDGKVHITLGNEVNVSRAGLTSVLIKYLSDNLNILNADYIIKKKTGKSTYNTPIYFKCIKENDTSISFPKGMIGKLLRFCREKEIIYELKDNRVKLEEVIFKSDISLYDYQKTAILASDKKDIGIITAPPGTGKTVIALSIIARKKKPALIIVHRKQLFDQWIERIQSFLGIPKFRIGKIEGGKYDEGNEITVAMIQSLQTLDFSADFYSKFGTIIVDECHHIPAKTFSDVIQKFNCYYLYGFTATPFRKGSDEKLIFIYLGEVIHEVILPEEDKQLNRDVSIIIRDTPFFTPFESKTDNTETLLSVLIHDTGRNELVINDIKKEAVAGRKILVLTERKAHAMLLNQYLKGKIETITITGDDPAYLRKSKLQQIEEGNFQVLISTGQFIGEGVDIAALDCLILAYPFSFEGKLIQYIGRVQRTSVKPVIYDYRDSKVEYLDKQFKQRNKYYRKLSKSGQLKPFEDLVLIFDKDKLYIGSVKNELSITDLDLPLAVDAFYPDTCWKVRVLKYEESGELTCEIVDYNFSIADSQSSLANDFYFQGIEKIKFRSIDTGAFLRSVILKKSPVIHREIESVPISEGPLEKTIFKTMKVHFSRINFLYCAVSFSLHIQEIGQDILFEIGNIDIRPEFEAIREYFIKVIKKKTISVNLSIIFSEKGIISSTATSEDIDCINSTLIESVRFEFVKRHFFKPKEGISDKPATLEDITANYSDTAKHLFSSDQELLDNILKVKDSKHYHHLKYLSSRHEANILKLRFVLQPFSFLFLLAGEKRYYIVWETLDSEEATYIWHSEKSREALRKMLADIEEVITGIKKAGRHEYLKRDDSNFSRILHDYSDKKKGFITWKGLLEERLV